jgi:hypothetical protein
VLVVVELYSFSNVASGKHMFCSLTGLGQELGRASPDVAVTWRARLTPRELEVLLAAARGNARTWIAQLLVVCLDREHSRRAHLRDIWDSDRAAQWRKQYETA